MTRYEIRFNHFRQTLIFLRHGSILTFRKRYDCDAYYCAKVGRLAREGVFGYLHIPKVDNSLYWVELIAHEVQHAMIDWILSKANDLDYLRTREEQVATMTGEITRKFWKKYMRDK